MMGLSVRKHPCCSGYGLSGVDEVEGNFHARVHLLRTCKNRGLSPLKTSNPEKGLTMSNKYPKRIPFQPINYELHKILCSWIDENNRVWFTFDDGTGQPPKGITSRFIDRYSKETLLRFGLASLYDAQYAIVSRSGSVPYGVIIWLMKEETDLPPRFRVKRDESTATNSPTTTDSQPEEPRKEYL